jgi:hypothetical protein
MRQTAQVPSPFSEATASLDEEAFQALFGRWDPLEPEAVRRMLGPTTVRWYIAGGRAARAGAPPRHHEDTDVIVRMDDLAELRTALAGWHLWEAHSGSLRPLLPGVGLSEGREQLWARLDAQHPWQLDILLDRSGAEWAFKRDASITLPWERVLHVVDGITFLRPEVALLHKAHLDRPKDRADLAAARLDPQARAWLAATLDQLGYAEWAQLARSAGDNPLSPARQPG